MSDPRSDERSDHNIREGSREAIAEALIRNERMIRRVARLKMSSSLNAAFDSQDIFSTLIRRIDSAVAQDRLSFDDRKRLMGYVLRATDRVIIDKARTVSRQRRAEASATPATRELMPESRAGDPERPALGQLMDSLNDERDLVVIESYLAGRPQRVTAKMLNSSTEAIRERWKRIRARLCEQYEGDS